MLLSRSWQSCLLKNQNKDPWITCQLYKMFLELGHLNLQLILNLSIWWEWEEVNHLGNQMIFLVVSVSNLDQHHHKSMNSKKPILTISRQSKRSNLVSKLCQWIRLFQISTNGSSSSHLVPHKELCTKMRAFWSQWMSNISSIFIDRC